MQSECGLLGSSRKTLLWLVLTGLLSAAGPQTPPSVEPGDTAPYRISVNVNLVVLHASVFDRQHQFVSGLAEKDFEVYEDGVKQAIRLFRLEDAPVTVGLVIDHSGSMHRKLADVTEAARTFIRFSNVEDELFVVNFNDRVAFGLPARIRFSDDSNKLAAAISSTPTMGKTAFYDAIIKARERLNEGSRDKKALILISDGDDNASRYTFAEVLHMIEGSSAVVYTIGIFDEDDPDKNPVVLRRLAHVTGGEAFFPEELSEIGSICERIARDIRSQYTIGYVSRNVAAPGTFRAIRLVAHSAGKRNLSVRTRSGYIAADESALAKSGVAK